MDIEFRFDSHLDKWLCLSSHDMRELEINPEGKMFKFSIHWISSLDHYLDDYWGYFDNVLFTILEHTGNEGEIKVCRIECVL